MAGRLPGVHDQALNRFVTNSPWDVVPVRRLAVRMDEAIGPAAWALDDTGWLKCGRASPGVARQYTGTAGKVTNCQIGVSLNLVTDVASCPVDWRLFLPESCGIPPRRPLRLMSMRGVCDRRSLARSGIGRSGVSGWT